MGNIAVITTAHYDLSGAVIKRVFENELGVYLHWNGGRDSVEAFLTYCKLKGYRSPTDDCYGWARLCQVIGNFFGGGNSLGIDTCGKLDCNNYDNGVYLINGWDIVGRVYHEGAEQQHYPLKEILIAINEAQPQNEQIPLEDIENYFNNKV